jgi:hypothetical protein
MFWLFAEKQTAKFIESFNSIGTERTLDHYEILPTAAISFIGLQNLQHQDF